MSEKIITLNEEAVKTELKDLVRKSVEETLNELLDSEIRYTIFRKKKKGAKVDMFPHFW